MLHHEGCCPRTRRPSEDIAKRSRGYTLTELMIVLAIAGILLSIAIPSYEKSVEAARVARAIGDLNAIQKDILVFDALNGRLPNTLGEIARDTLQDPWGNPYEYLNFFADPGKPGQGKGRGKGSGKGNGNQGTISPEVKGKMRRDRNLHPINSRFDLYSKGKDGKSVPPLTAQVSWDDIIRANDGSFIGLAANY